MEVDEKIKNFTNLLRIAFQATGFNEIYIREKTLEENGLVGSTFWEIVCPLLEKDGVLTYYDNPDSPTSSLTKALIANYRPLLGRASGSVSAFEDNYHKVRDAKVLELEIEFRNSYRHKFVVDGIKLLGTLKVDRFSKSKQATKIEIYLDPEKGIYTVRAGKNIRYPKIKNTSKIFIALIYLKDNGQSTLKDIAGLGGQAPKTTKRGINAFNENAKRIFKLHDCPVIGDDIYELNPKFDFI